MIDTLRHIIEKSVFGVCSTLAGQMGLRSSRVRLYFIYLSFVTLGSPVIIYLILAFWINFKKYLRRGYHLMMD